MTNLPRDRSSGPFLSPLVFLLTVVAAAAMLAGCGGGGDAETAADAGSGSSGAMTADPAPGEKSDTGRERTRADHGTPDASLPPGNRDDAQGDSTPSHENAVGGVPKANPAGTKVGVRSGRCPARVTREQCRSLAEQPISSAPSHVVESPEDCVKAMSQTACEEIFAVEQASRGSAGQSVDVEHCLEERSRAQCEAQLAAQLEAQYAASKGE